MYTTRIIKQEGLNTNIYWRGEYTAWYYLFTFLGQISGNENKTNKPEDDSVAKRPRMKKIGASIVEVKKKQQVQSPGTK